eukprot:2246682-Rhodomonas_salina.1
MTLRYDGVGVGVRLRAIIVPTAVDRAQRLHIPPELGDITRSDRRVRAPVPPEVGVDGHALALRGHEAVEGVC